MTTRRILFRLGKGSFDLNVYRDEDWELVRDLVRAAAEGVHAAGGTATVTVSEDREEEL